MPKERVRKSIVACQIALFGLGIFLLWGFIEIEGSMSFWYRGPPPGLLLILGTLCIIGVILLFSVVRYEVKEDKTA